MPIIYEYLGVIFFFYSNDHFPVHIHAQYAEFENKIEFEYENGKLVNIKFKKIKGKKEIPQSKRKDIKKFIFKYHLGIVNKWTDFFVLHKKPKSEKISKKI